MVALAAISFGSVYAATPVKSMQTDTGMNDEEKKDENEDRIPVKMKMKMKKRYYKNVVSISKKSLPDVGRLSYVL